MANADILPAKKRVALVAHDGRKDDLVEWVKQHRDALLHHDLYGTGGTSALIAAETGLTVNRFMSGPLGGDQQIGAAIATRQLDMLVFFWDPLEPQPHDPDVKALLRLAVLHNIPTASNRSTADFLITSTLMGDEYTRRTPDFGRHLRK
jgi:methylglyoxal synthase